MRKRIALLCIAVFCLALFAAAAHYHGSEGMQRYCTICQLSSLSFAAVNSSIHICQAWTRSTGSSLTAINLPEPSLARLDARAPPA